MNIAERLVENAKIYPNKDAIRFPKKARRGSYKYDTLSFKELDDLSSNFAFKLKKAGFTMGMKVLLFVRPSLDFPAITFALFKLGVVPILIDPGMGKKNLLSAISQARPEALIAEPEVHFLKALYPEAFSSIKLNVTTKGVTWANMLSLKKLKKGELQPFKMENIRESDNAAILFTSGGTGVPKGVVYTHKIFNEQTNILQELFGLTESDVDIPGFPLFSLFAIAMGMTSCPPDMNPSRPSRANPKKLVKNIQDNKGTFVAGSPAIWERLADYCIENKITLDSIKYLVMFGAPVRTELHKKFKKILTNGSTFTPYGATESLPVSCISGDEVLKRTAELTDKGRGTCVGMPVPGIDVKIIKVSDQTIVDLRSATELEREEIGEIIVSGDVVTAKYYKMPDHTALAKIHEDVPDGRKIWHRIGDLGYFDKDGRIWFCGRKTHRVQLDGHFLCSVQCEAIFNNHPEVSRTALIAHRDHCAIVIERVDGKILTGKAKTAFEKELMDLGKKFTHTRDIKTFFYSANFPVDIRHNIKIDRIKLRNQFAQMESK